MQDCYESSDLLNIGLLAVKTAFQATNSKRIRNIASYFDGTLDRLLDRL